MSVCILFSLHSFPKNHAFHNVIVYAFSQSVTCDECNFLFIFVLSSDFVRFVAQPPVHNRLPKCTQEMAEFFDYDDSDMFLDETLLILEVWRYPLKDTNCRRPFCEYTIRALSHRPISREWASSIRANRIAWVWFSINCYSCMNAVQEMYSSRFEKKNTIAY